MTPKGPTVEAKQPGDIEDREGVPFVGPAGRLLDRALDEAGLPRENTYLTNAVKHFRFTQRGKRRIHEKPDLGHLSACKPWLDAELAEVDPRLVVVMGATAARAVLGPGIKVTKQRGEILIMDTTRGERRFMATVHPSSILRARGDREVAYQALVDDLRVAAGVVGL
ncbi:MAG: UdgX family uracil-DNA binding protein [Geodermatophilaceae bacterium]